MFQPYQYIGLDLFGYLYAPLAQVAAPLVYLASVQGVQSSSEHVDLFFCISVGTAPHEEVQFAIMEIVSLGETSVHGAVIHTGMTGKGATATRAGRRGFAL